jgi:hypothetical protein
MKMSECKIAIFDFLHFLMIMVHYRHENEADAQAAVPAEVQAPLGDVVAPGAAPPTDLLAPHGQFWTSQPDGELVIVDPTAEVQWGPAPRINRGNAHAEPVTCRPLDFFFTLLPMGFLREVLVPATNANLQEMTAAVTTAGEFAALSWPYISYGIRFRTWWYGYVLGCNKSLIHVRFRS